MTCGLTRARETAVPGEIWNPARVAPEAREGKARDNLLRAVESFAWHVEHCRQCWAVHEGTTAAKRACSRGEDLWRVVEHRADPARWIEERSHG